MRSASNRGVVQSRLQVLHVHVFLVAPLGARHMAEPGADQHQSGIAIGECPHHTGAPTDLTVQPLDHIVGADTRPMLAGKIAVGQRLLNAVLDLLGSLIQFHGAQLGESLGIELALSSVFPHAAQTTIVSDSRINNNAFFMISIINDIFILSQKLLLFNVSLRAWDYPKNENRAFRLTAETPCFSGVGTHRICLLLCKEILIAPRWFA